MNKETLEEAAEKYARKQCDDMYDNIGLTGASWGWETALDFTNGAKWQAEQDQKTIDKLVSIIQWYDNESDVRPDAETFMWFEQFKKK